MTAAAVKPFRWPYLWLGLWWLAVLAVIVLSLMPPPPVALPQHGDKVEHLLGYGLMAAAAVQIYATPRARLLAGAGLVLLGVLIELAQGALTTTRMADAADALANAVGVALGLATALTPWRDLLLRLERRRAG